MTASKSTSFFLSFLFLTTLLIAQPEEEIDWQYEIDLLGKELAQRHCNLFFKIDSATFYRKFERIKAGTKDHSLFEISVQLQQVMATMGDSHTRINYHFNIDSRDILPVECYWFEEGIYILQTRDLHRAILGKRVTAINGYPITQIIDSLSTLVVDENPYLLRSQLPRMITWTPLFDYFGFGRDDGIELAYEAEPGIIETMLFSLSEEDGAVINAIPDELPLGWQDQNSYFTDQYFPEEQLYYIQYNRCWSREVEEDFGTGATALFMPSFKEFEKEVFRTIRKQVINKLVFDMRFNSGGNSAQGTRFINRLCKSKFKGSGDIYLIVGRQTFSSAIINAVDLMNKGDVVIVGEGTGGRPNHFGEVKRFVLPESKLVVNHSTKFFKLLEEDAPSIVPDLNTPISFEAYMKGIDPAMKAIQNHYLNQ